MGAIQALLGLLTKSAGKILNAIFGWSVRALFGRTSSTEETFLSGLVGAAVAWPLLLAGLIAPKLAALLLAFVPIPHWIPSWVVRLVWLGLALLVPLAMGIAVTARGSATLAKEPVLKRLMRGFPITVGLAAAFLIMFVSVPIIGKFVGNWSPRRLVQFVCAKFVAYCQSYKYPGNALHDTFTKLLVRAMD